MRQVLVLTLLSCFMIGSAHAQVAPAKAESPTPAPAPAPSAAPAPAPSASPAPAPEAPSAAPVAAQPAAGDAAVPSEPAATGPVPPAPPAPPPTAGAVYAPLPPAAQAQPGSRAELESVNERLYLLQRERSQHGIGGPIAMVAAGYGSALVFSLVALGGLVTAEAIENDDVDRDDFEDFDSNDDGVLDEEDERNARRVARVSAGLAAVGLGVGIGGTVFLLKRLAKRREHAPEIRDLRMRRRQLLGSVRYGANVGPSSLELSMSATF